MWEPSLPFHLCFKDECHAHCHGARFEPNLMLVFKGQENCLFSFSSSSSSFSLPSSFLKTKLSTSLENNPHLTLKLDDSLTFRALELQIRLNCFCLKFAASAPGCCLLTQLKPVLCEEKVLLSLPTASLAGQTGDWNWRSLSQCSLSKTAPKSTRHSNSASPTLSFSSSLPSRMLSQGLFIDPNFHFPLCDTSKPTDPCSFYPLGEFCHRDFLVGLSFLS